MGAFENACSEMTKEYLVEALGKALDQIRGLKKAEVDHGMATEAIVEQTAFKRYDAGFKAGVAACIKALSTRPYPKEWCLRYTPEQRWFEEAVDSLAGIESDGASPVKRR